MTGLVFPSRKMFSLRLISILYSVSLNTFMKDFTFVPPFVGFSVRRSFSFHFSFFQYFAITFRSPFFKVAFKAKHSSHKGNKPSVSELVEESRLNSTSVINIAVQLEVKSGIGCVSIVSVGKRLPNEVGTSSFHCHYVVKFKTISINVPKFEKNLKLSFCK